MNRLMMGAVAASTLLAVGCGAGQPRGFDAAWCDLPQTEAVEVMLATHEGYEPFGDPALLVSEPYPVETYHEWLSTYAECAG